MFKNTANTSKIYILNANDFKHIDISKKTANILKTESVSEKNPSNFQIVNHLHEKRPSKNCMGSKKWHMCQEHLQTIETMAQ